MPGWGCGGEQYTLRQLGPPPACPLMMGPEDAPRLSSWRPAPRLVRMRSRWPQPARGHGMPLWPNLRHGQAHDDSRCFPSPRSNPRHGHRPLLQHGGMPGRICRLSPLGGGHRSQGKGGLRSSLPPLRQPGMALGERHCRWGARRGPGRASRAGRPGARRLRNCDASSMSCGRSCALCGGRMNCCAGHRSLTHRGGWRWHSLSHWWLPLLVRPPRRSPAAQCCPSWGISSWIRAQLWDSDPGSLVDPQTLSGRRG